MGEDSEAHSRQLNIGLDLDGVIVDHTENKIRAARQLGFDIEKKDTPSEIIEKLIPKKEYREFQRMVYEKMSLEGRPVPFAKSTIRRLANKNHALFIISRRHKGSKNVLLWIHKHGINQWIPEERIVFVETDEEKAIYARKFELDMFLDDKTEVLDYLRDITQPILFNNHKANINQYGYSEVHSWKEFFNFVQRYE